MLKIVQIRKMNQFIKEINGRIKVKMKLKKFEKFNLIIMIKNSTENEYKLLLNSLETEVGRDKFFRIL